MSNRASLFWLHVGIHIKIGIFLRFVMKSILCVVLPKSKSFPFRSFPNICFPSTHNSGFHLVVCIHDLYVLFNLCPLTYWIGMIGTVHKHWCLLFFQDTDDPYDRCVSYLIDRVSKIQIFLSKTLLYFVAIKLCTEIQSNIAK